MSSTRSLNTFAKSAFCHYFVIGSLLLKLQEFGICRLCYPKSELQFLHKQLGLILLLAGKVLALTELVRSVTVLTRPTVAPKGSAAPLTSQFASVFAVHLRRISQVALVPVYCNHVLISFIIQRMLTEENSSCSFSLTSADLAVSHSVGPHPSPSARSADPTLKRLSVCFL